MALTSFSLNGVPIENYGLVAVDLGDWLSISQRQYPVAQQPYRPGVLPIGTASSIAPRTMTLGAYFGATSLSDRRVRLNTILKQMSGPLEIISAEDPLKVCYGFLTEAPITPEGLAFVNPGITAAFRITCFDPLWYDIDPQLVGAPAAGNWATLNFGTAPMRRIRFQIVGAATNPVVKLRSGNLNTLATMTFTVTLGANDYLDVDCDTYTITKYTAGVASNALSTLGSTETFFMHDTAESQPGNITCTSGSMVLSYYRAYW